MKGLEPSLLSELEPKSSASANSATSATVAFDIIAKLDRLMRDFQRKAIALIRTCRPRLITLLAELISSTGSQLP